MEEGRREGTSTPSWPSYTPKKLPLANAWASSLPGAATDDEADDEDEEDEAVEGPSSTESAPCWRKGRATIRSSMDLRSPCSALVPYRTRVVTRLRCSPQLRTLKTKKDVFVVVAFLKNESKYSSTFFFLLSFYFRNRKAHPM